MVTLLWKWRLHWFLNLNSAIIFIARQMRARSALYSMMFVSLRTRRALSLYNVYHGDSVLLDFNETSLNSVKALLDLNRRKLEKIKLIVANYVFLDQFGLFS